MEVMMELRDLIRLVELFEGLTDPEILEVISIGEERIYRKGEMVVAQGKQGNELFIITEGAVEVTLQVEKSPPRVVIILGKGQLIGEMSLVDEGPRSATVRALDDPTIVQVIQHDEFHKLCQQNTRIGYIVMRNMAADLSYKLRHRHLSVI
jgi:CRP-like cAMP-binding protein